MGSLTQNREQSTNSSFFWTDDQREVISFFESWSEDRKPFGAIRISGSAGSGKTTVLRAILAALGDFQALPTRLLYLKNSEDDCDAEDADELPTGCIALAAPTNLAAKRASQSTCFKAVTLHRLCQRLLPSDSQQIKALRERMRTADESEIEGLLDQIEALSEPRFEPWWDAVKACSLLIIDEASMVPASMVEEILKHCPSVVLLGDHCQLGPVNAGRGAMEGIEPDFRLRTIHRQGEGTSLSRDLEAIRCGLRPVTELSIWRNPNDGLAETVKRAAPFAHEMGEGRMSCLVICDTNANRTAMTRLIRRQMGAESLMPIPGDLLRVMAWTTGLGLAPREVVQVLDVHFDTRAGAPVVTRWKTLSGVIRTEPFGVNPRGLAETDSHKASVLLRLDWDDYLERHGLPASKAKALLSRDGVPFIRCQFAAASTCHGVQGQETDHALAILTDLRKFPDAETRQRLIYVATSRGRLSAQVFCPPRLEPVNLDGGRP